MLLNKKDLADLIIRKFNVYKDIYFESDFILHKDSGNFFQIHLDRYDFRTNRNVMFLSGHESKKTLTNKYYITRSELSSLVAKNRRVKLSKIKLT